MKIAIFSKLTLKEDEIKDILKEADVFPPIKRGDLMDSKIDSYDIIGIIDGVFLQNSAVAHREILKRLNEGKKIFGASSMGALRASELDTYGMIGVGKIYEYYKNGIITDDDEVAVTFSEDFHQITFSMINFRIMVQNAIKDGIIHEKDGEDLLKIAKSLYYPLRTFENVLEKSKFEEDMKEKLLSYFKTQDDIKRSDAFEMLYKIKKYITKI